MASPKSLALALLCHLAVARPTVQLDNGTFTGTTTGSAPNTTSNTTSFLGIPFAFPPVGDLRFRLPVAHEPYNGSFNATTMSPACTQQALVYPDLTLLPFPLGVEVNAILHSVYTVVTPDSEDCLYINVIKPNWATSTSNLPVVVWIYGGAFQTGSTSQNDGKVIVERSIFLNKPVIYVSMNYRLSALGFLAGPQVQQANISNIGLQDQRLALRWVQTYIAAFGGDPTKVTIWGESAGAISVSLHMIANNGNPEGLFRAAFMQSGSPIPIGNETSMSAEQAFNQFVTKAGCNGTTDPIACLRQANYTTIKAAQDASPGPFSSSGLAHIWLPRGDGVFLTDNPQTLVENRVIAQVPVVTGDCDDEGTMFALANTNLITDDDFRGWVQQFWYPNATKEQLDKLLKVYPSTLPEGSPFNTSYLNGLTPQFKRIAAYEGDLVFEAPRRFFQSAISQNQWAFLSKRLKATPLLGSYHGSDLPFVYSQSLLLGELRDALIYFINNLDPV
ncbi:carotenoid ester lipase precursor [Roridomyces roridus]|uniref:Carboxylic ester hydrolase n=1 Tax=Roridomyces roridus TaxID=1738132 RepID=A0AAD7BL60_9AGAR|nr:carotenoid ester lipase precursor [Roridomyces roridus]